MRTVGDRNPVDPDGERDGELQRSADRIYANYMDRLAAGDKDVADEVLEYLHYDRNDLLHEIVKVAAIGNGVTQIDRYFVGSVVVEAVNLAVSRIADREARNEAEG